MDRGSPASRFQSQYKETVCFLPLCPQEFLVLIWSTTEGWKAESTFNPPTGFEIGNPEFGIQHLITRSLLKNYENQLIYLFASVLPWWVFKNSDVADKMDWTHWVKTLCNSFPSFIGKVLYHANKISTAFVMSLINKFVS